MHFYFVLWFVTIDKARMMTQRKIGINSPALLCSYAISNTYILEIRVTVHRIRIIVSIDNNMSLLSRSAVMDETKTLVHQYLFTLK